MFRAELPMSRDLRQDPSGKVREVRGAASIEPDHCVQLVAYGKDAEPVLDFIRDSLVDEVEAVVSRAGMVRRSTATTRPMWMLTVAPKGSTITARGAVVEIVTPEGETISC